MLSKHLKKLFIKKEEGSETEDVEDKDGYRTVTYKRKGSQSPEDIRSQKKTKDEADNEMVKNFYQRMGLEMFLVN